MSGSVLAFLGGIGWAALVLGLAAFFRDGEVSGWPWGSGRTSAGPSTGPEAEKEPAAGEAAAAAKPHEVASRRPIGSRHFHI